MRRVLRHLRHLLRLTAWGTLAVFLALLGTLLWLMTTQQGLHLLLQQASSQGLTVQQARGRLLTGVDLQGVRLELGTTTIAAQHLQLRWSLWQLPLLGTLVIDRLKADALVIGTQPTPAAPEKPLPQIRLPLPISLHHLEITKLSYRVAQQERYGAERIWLAAQASGSTITVQQLALQQPDHHATLAGTIRLQQAYPMRLMLRAGLDHLPGAKPDTPPVTLRGNAHGDLQRLQVRLQTTAPQGLSVEGRLSHLLQDIEADALVRLAPFNMAAWFDGAPEGSYGGAIHIQGDLDHLQLDARLAVSHSPLGHGAMIISAQKKGDALANIQADWHSTSGTLHAQGAIASMKTMQAKAMLSWQNLHLPDAPDWQLDSGTLHLTGSAEGFNLRGTSQVTWRRADQAPAALHAAFTTRIAPQVVQVTQATLHGFGATMTLQGSMSLQSSMQFALQGALHDVDPGRFSPQWPGLLEALWEAQGHLSPHWQVTASVSQLHGQLRQRAVRGLIKATVAPGRYQLTALELHSGKAYLQAQGQLNHELSLALQLKAPRLDDLLPQASGSLHIAANLAGPLMWPALRLEANGHDLRYQDWTVKTLHSSGALFLPTDNRPGTLRLEALQWRFRSVQIAKLLWQLEGTAKQHRLDLRADGHAYGLERTHLILAGGYSGNQWQGILKGLELQHADLGHYTLRQPSTLSWSPPEGFAIGRLCLQQTPMMLCAQGSALGTAQAAVSVSLHQVSLSHFEPLLPTGYHITGKLQGQADLRQEQGRWRGQGHIDLSTGKLTMEDDSATGLPPIVLLDMPAGHLRVAMGKQWRLSSQWHLANQGLLQFQGSTNDPSGTTIKTLPIRASLRLQRLPLGFLGAAFPQMAAVDMEANGRLDVDGTMSQPIMKGGLAISQGRCELPALGLEIRDLDLQLHTAQNNRLKLDGALSSGPGRLHVAATGSLHQGLWQAQGTIQGKEVLLADIPQAHVIGSTNLSITMTPKRLHLAGLLALPKGKLQPALLPSGVDVSPDEVIVGQQAKQNTANQETSIPLSARLHLVAGPDLAIRAKGVQGKLEGDLTAVVEPGNPAVGVGELRLVEGSYKAYGQELQINTGRVLFTGGPLSNPGLDLQASRAIEGGTVGLHVRGTVNQPELSLTSDPPLPESDKLAYLLFGRQLSQTSAEESSMINQGLLNAGVRGSEFLAKMVGKRFGLSDVHVESTAGMPESSQLVVGRQLGPRLSVGYGIGIFDGLSTAHITYSLTPSLSLRTQAGAETAADLLYSLER